MSRRWWHGRAYHRGTRSRMVATTNSAETSPHDQPDVYLQDAQDLRRARADNARTAWALRRAETSTSIPWSDDIGFVDEPALTGRSGRIDELRREGLHTPVDRYV